MRRFDFFLPYVPTQKEADIFISSLSDLKPKAMVSLMYSAGLRVGEVCRPRYCDIERKNMRIHIAHTKNRSDCYALLSQKALDILTQYWFEYGRPCHCLFPKQTDPSRPIDTFYIIRHMRVHEESLGWEHQITCHSFRHAFDTHLYENGTDLLTIQNLIGHKALNSTLIYIHLASYQTRNILELSPGSFRCSTSGTKNLTTMSICTASFPEERLLLTAGFGSLPLSFSSRSKSYGISSRGNISSSWMRCISRRSLRFPLSAKHCGIPVNGQLSKTVFTGRTGVLTSKRPLTALAMPSSIWDAIPTGSRSPTTGFFPLQKQWSPSQHRAEDPGIQNGRSLSAMKSLSSVS